MSTPKLAPAPVTVRHYLSEALQPGGVVMDAYFIMTGAGAYGQLVGYIRLQTSGVKPPAEDVGDFTVNGTWAFMGGKPGEVIGVTFNSLPSPLVGGQTIHGQMSLKNDWKTGHVAAHFTARGGHPLVTLPSAKVNLVS
jgi:hypothetical protein